MFSSNFLVYWAGFITWSYSHALVLVWPFKSLPDLHSVFTNTSREPKNVIPWFYALHFIKRMDCISCWIGYVGKQFIWNLSWVHKFYFFGRNRHEFSQALTIIKDWQPLYQGWQWVHRYLANGKLIFTAQWSDKHNCSTWNSSSEEGSLKMIWSINVEVFSVILVALIICRKLTRFVLVAVFKRSL